MIEEGFFNQDISTRIIINYLNNKSIIELDSLILACTHYPLIKNEIMRFYKNKVEVIDSSELTADYIKSELQKNKINNIQSNSSYNFIVSNLTESFSNSASYFFKGKINLEEIDIWR